MLECLRAGRRRARRLYLLRGGKGLEPLRKAAGAIPIEERDRGALNQLSGGVVHQGAVLDADPLPVLSVDEWLARSLAGRALAVVLDGIEDPHNFGAIVRTAAACGVCGVLFGKQRAAPLSPAAVKSAAGAMEYVDLVQVGSLVRHLGAVREAGFFLAGLDERGPGSIWDAGLPERTVLVIGGEGAGIRPLVARQCDALFRIPLPGPIRTLNASVSAAIALAEWVRRGR